MVGLKFQREWGVEIPGPSARCWKFSEQLLDCIIRVQEQREEPCTDTKAEQVKVESLVGGGGSVNSRSTTDKGLSGIV